MKNFFKQLFDDNNTINEKSVVGFLAFVMMTLFAIADIVTGSLGKDLVINEFIFNAFLWLVLGSFGIGSVDKWINKGKNSEPEELIQTKSLTQSEEECIAYRYELDFITKLKNPELYLNKNCLEYLNKFCD